MTKMSDQAFNVEFVEEVEKYPCLYNYQLTQYSRKDITDLAWNNIGKKMNLPASACKEKWKNLRAVFVRQMKPGPSGSSAKKKKYYLTDIMQFIVPFVKTTTPSQSSNLPETETSQDLQEEEASTEASSEIIGEVEENEKEDTLEQMHSSQYDTSIRSGSQISKKKVEKARTSSVQESQQNIGLTPQKKVFKCKKPLDEVDKTFVNYLKGRELQRQDTNTRKSFLISLLDETEDMSNDQWKLFKRRVFSLIDEIKTPSKAYIDQFQNELENPPSNRSTMYTPSEQSYSSHHSNQSQQLAVVYNDVQFQINATEDSTSTPFVYSSAQNALLQSPQP